MRYTALTIFLFWWQFHEGQLAINWGKFDLKEGQEQYTVVMDRTKHPIYGGCWLQAVDKLRSDCDHLTADIQRILAFRFSNCFLETSGLNTYKCSEAEQDLNNCIKRMKDRDFNVYTAFFTHTANMCFFLTSQLWNLETERTINRLVDTSAIVTAGMKSALRMQEEQMARDDERMVKDKEYREAMTAAMESSRMTALDVVQQVVQIRETIFGELDCIYTVAFYFFFSGLSLLLTSTKRTEAARFWLFCVFMSALVLERFAVDRIPDVGFEEIKDSAYLTTWFIRKASICTAIVVLGVSIYRYRDFTQINHQLMKETNETVRALNQYLMQTKMLTAATVNCNGVKDIQRCNGIVRRHHDPSYVPPSDEESFSVGESERFTDVSFSETNRIPVKRSPLNYSRRKKDLNTSSVSPNSRYNLRDRSKISSPDLNVLMYESPEMFSIAVHRMANSTQRQSETLRRTLVEKRLKMQDYEQ